MTEPELNEVITVIRCILQSAPSDGLLTRELLNDYKSIQGSPLPFKKFGYNSVDELIQTSGEFIQKRTADGIKFIPKESKESAHNYRMVQQQKSTRKKKKSTFLPTPRRPVHSPTANNQQQRWRGSAYTDLYSRTPNRSLKKAVAATGTAKTTTTTTDGPSIPSLMSLNIEPPSFRLNRPYGQGTQQNANGGTNNQHANVAPTTTSTPFARKYVNQDMRPITKQSNIVDNGKFNYNSNKIEPPNQSPNSSSMANGHGGNRIQNRITVNNNIQTTSSTPATMSRAASHASAATNDSAGINNAPRTKQNVSTLNNRLAKYQNTDQMARTNLDADVVDFVNAPNVDNNSHSHSHSQSIAKAQTKSIQFDELERLISTEALARFCHQKCYAQPAYVCFRIPRTHKFQCRVTVNDVIYSTYPSEFDTESDARVDAARSAFQQIKETALQDKYEVCMDRSMELAFKILHCITPSVSGVFQKKLPQLFQEKYELTLPENWCDVITQYPQMFTIDDCIADKIISPNHLLDAKPESNEETNENSYLHVSTEPQPLTVTITQMEIDELILPWKEKHWNVFITNPVSTVEVWARIIGPEYSGKMDTLLTDIELELFSNKQVAETIEMEKIYLVMISECWYRARIEKKDLTQKRVLCFFIDVGDDDWYPFDQIYVCDPKFVRFPPQAICLTLFGLEDFAENPNARQQVEDHLAGKSLIAEVMTTQDEYVAKDRSNDLEAKIQTILYDTSSDEDIQLNKLISEKICEKTDAPQLQRFMKFNHIYISYITDAGDVYCHLYNSKSSLQYINKLIHQLTDGTFDYTQYRYVDSDMGGNLMQNLYLIYDKSEHKWYRAAILPTNSIASTEQCKCIDYGMTKTIEREHIYRLDLLSAALNMYPAQAILMRLNEITSYNENVIARLRGLLNSTSMVMAQVVNSGTIPLVNIYKRLESTKVLCKINDTIRMEQELENSSDLFFDVNDSFNSSSASSVKSQKNNNLTIKRNNFFELPLCEVPSRDEFFNCVVIMASNPSNFMIQPFKRELEFKQMMENLQKYCNANNKTVSEDTIREGGCYAGLNKDKIWNRVIIKRVMSAGMVVVYNCDCGDITMLTTNDLRPLAEQFLLLPQMAIPAKLYGIRPKNKDWSTDDCSRFQILTVGKRFASEIRAIKWDQTKYELEIILIDVSTERDIRINNVLIEEGRAH